MDKVENFNEWRAEKLGYVYFSRLNDLIINEPNFRESLFDYLIDIGENDKQTGRLFGVEVKALNGKNIPDQSTQQQYKNISFPALLVYFDNKTDNGYFKWIKRPESNGSLQFEAAKDYMEELNNSSLVRIVDEIKGWYAHQ